MSTARRLDTIVSHIAPSSSRHDEGSLIPTDVAGSKNPLDAVIVCAVRTPIGKARRGSFAKMSPDQLLTPVLKHVKDSFPQVPSSDIGDIVIGTVLPRGGQGATEVRVAGLLAGFPEEVPVHTVNRQCSSGLQAIAHVAGGIKAGYYDAGIAGGVESMSNNPMSWEGSVNPAALAHDTARGCYMTMGQTSEEVAERYGITREQQDKLGAMSQERAIAATKSGRFKDEIIPIHVEAEVDGKTVHKVVEHDEGLRATTVEKLGKLRAAFKPGGTTTAGNASQTSDGAAATLVTSRAYAEAKGLPILGVLRSFAVAGVDPAVMGIGPAVAIPKAVARAGLSMSDVDLFEINEAFASQATYCVEKLGLSWDKVNVNGGAIAIGHPLGCTGARMTATLLHEMRKRNDRYGVVSMCIGSGMGAAAVYEVEY